MKTIFFIRHAKSSWENPSLKDIERPLNPRGLRDAPFMAKALRARGMEVDLFISSPANRAYTTASYFATEFGVEQDKIQVESLIYHAYTEELFSLIRSLPDSLNTVCIFGHNPTYTSMANLFSKDEYITNVPTCGIVKVVSSSRTWRAFSENNAKFKDFIYPKMYFN